jgi:hypothetical protein
MKPVSGRWRPFGVIEHLAGGTLALVVFMFTVPIATALSDSVAWAAERLSADGSIGFVVFELNVSIWWPLSGMVLLGLLVAGFDGLAGRQLIGPCVPPLAVLAFALGGFALLAGGDMGWQGRASIGGGLGGVVALAFAVWWLAALGIARWRRRDEHHPGLANV